MKPSLDRALPFMMKTDLPIFMVFMIFAIIFQIGRGATGPEILDLGEDAANIASFAAALDHPDYFKHDMVLGDANNFRFYKTIHIPLIRWLVGISGSYGNAFIAMIGAHVFLMLSGFYLFGRLLFRSRIWGFVLTWLLLLYVAFHFGTFWGIYYDPLPRLTFSSLLGFLLASFLQWRDHHKVWPLIFIALGLCMFVHPVSTPSIAFAMWLGCIPYLPAEWSLGRRSVFHLMNGLVFLLAASPFIFNYHQNHAHGVMAGSREALEIFLTAFKQYTIDLPHTYGLALWQLTRETMILPMGLFGAVLVYKFGDHEQRRLLSTFFMWLLGIFTVSVIMPLLEQVYVRETGAFPALLDLPRGTRFFIPIFLIMAVWGAMVFARQATVFGDYSCRHLIVILVCLNWVYLKANFLVLKTIPLQAFQASPATTEKHETIQAIRDMVPVGTPILAISNDKWLSIRYAALRPLVYYGKDRGMLGYANPEQLLHWKRINDLMKELKRAEGESTEQIKERMDVLIQKTKPEVLLIKKELVPEVVWSRIGKPVWQNGQNVIITLAPAEKGGNDSTTGPGSGL